MKTESPKRFTVLEYGRAPNRARWRTPLAMALAVPSGLWAGWWTDTNMAGWVAIVLFSVIGPLCLGLVALRYHALIGFLFCAAMSAALVHGSMRFYARIGDPYTLSQTVKGFTICLVISWLVSLIAIVPLMAAKQRAAQLANLEKGGNEKRDRSN